MLVLYAMPNEGELLRLLSTEISQEAHGASRFYSGSFGCREMTLGCTGIGPSKAAEAIDYALRAFAPDRVMVIGFCGGISSDLSVSDLVVPETVLGSTGQKVTTDGELSEEIAERAEEVIDEVFWGAGFRPRVVKGSFVTGDHMVLQKDEAMELASRGISCCDMELYPIVVSCHQAGIPVSGLKVVTDIPARGYSNPRFRIGKALSAAAAIRLALGDTGCT